MCKTGEDECVRLGRKKHLHAHHMLTHTNAHTHTYTHKDTPALQGCGLHVHTPM